MRETLALLKKAAWDWMEDQASTLGAALAFYTAFSLAPLLTITISIAGLVFGQEAAQGQIFAQLRSLIGAASVEAVQEVVQNANAKPATGVLTTIVGFVTLLFGASGVFGQLQISLNAIWGRGAEAGPRALGHRARSHSLVRLHPGCWLPVARFSYPHSSYRLCGRVVRRKVSGDRDTGSDCKLDIVTGGDRAPVRHDFQIHAGRQDCLARCVDWGLYYGRALHSWKARTRSIFGKKWY
jgi:hypothetical protein